MFLYVFLSPKKSISQKTLSSKEFEIQKFWKWKFCGKWKILKSWKSSLKVGGIVGGIWGVPWRLGHILSYGPSNKCHSNWFIDHISSLVYFTQTHVISKEGRRFIKFGSYYKMRPMYCTQVRAIRPVSFNPNKNLLTYFLYVTHNIYLAYICHDLNTWSWMCAHWWRC